MVNSYWHENTVGLASIEKISYVTRMRYALNATPDDEQIKKSIGMSTPLYDCVVLEICSMEIISNSPAKPNSEKTLMITQLTKKINFATFCFYLIFINSQFSIKYRSLLINSEFYKFLFLSLKLSISEFIVRRQLKFISNIVHVKILVYWK